MNAISAAVLVTLASGFGSPAAAADEHTITVYSRAAPGSVDPRMFERQIANPDYREQIPGYGVVRTRREMALDSGTGWVRFTDVAAAIDPTTVAFESLTAPDTTHVLEQNYRYDVASTERILDRYIGRTITVDQVRGDATETIEGELVSARGGDLILRRPDDSLVSLGGGAWNIRFPDLPEGLISQPTLEWLVSAERGGKHQIQVGYETLGMTWWADYNAIYTDADGCRLDLNAWVSLVNQSGGSFENATLKLIAGDVHRAPQPEPRYRLEQMRMTAADAAAEETGFTEKGFFEYHLYTLGRAVDLPDRSLKQLELFEPALGVQCEKALRFEAGGGLFYGPDRPYTQPQFPLPTSGDVGVYLTFRNDRETGLGMPLPRGRVRVNLEDPADGSLEFIGEDTIDHTPRNEEIELKIGDAFDVVVERVQADFSWSKDQQFMDETIEIRLRNQKDEPVTVDVLERLYRWTNWEIRDATHEYEKQDAATVEFSVTVGSEQEEVVRYTAHYTW